eukprot:2281938-Pyramimonas_sp.AAC.1
MRPATAARRLLRRGRRRLPQGRCAAPRRRPAGQWGWGCLGEDRGLLPTLVSSMPFPYKQLLPVAAAGVSVG